MLKTIIFYVFIFISVFILNVNAQDKDSEITCVPKFDGRKIVGFSCPVLHNESLLSKMGVQTEDLIMEFDGAIIDSYDRMQLFYEQLHRRELTKVKLSRSGQLMVLENRNEKIR